MQNFNNKRREFSFRAFILAIIITIILAMVNAFLALKLGILTSASIPAAILSMGFLKLFKNPSILENNIVQTAASAGEAIAGGIVYTIPAMIIINYWHHFDFTKNFLISISGGFLGVIFSIPLRKILVRDKNLTFPEGRAVAELLKASYESRSLQYILQGASIAAIFQFGQVGLHIFAPNIPLLFQYNGMIVGLIIGLSITMLGAGYLIGNNMTFSFIVGLVISCFVIMPIYSYYYPNYNSQVNYNDVIISYNLYWSKYVKYIGIGSLLMSGIIVLFGLFKPLYSRITQKNIESNLTDGDLPWSILLIMTVIFLSILYYLFINEFNFFKLGNNYIYCILWIIYILIIGIIFSVITSYFSAMVGVSASPGSAIVLAGLLLTSWIVLHAIPIILKTPFSQDLIYTAEAITIMTTSVLTGIAAIANDNSQDLKIGDLIGATPWKQELALLLGVLVSSLMMPLIMQLLFDVYGIAGVYSKSTFNIQHFTTLPAPVAAMIAGITKAMFENKLSWQYIEIGAALILCIYLLSKVFDKIKMISLLGVAMGIYLPSTTSLPLIFGGILGYVISKKTSIENYKKGALIACGIVTGSAIIEVLLTIPFSILGSTSIFSIFSEEINIVNVLSAVTFLVIFCLWFFRKIFLPERL